jgi:hypothetical protein
VPLKKEKKKERREGRRKEGWKEGKNSWVYKLV